MDDDEHVAKRARLSSPELTPGQSEDTDQAPSPPPATQESSKLSRCPIQLSVVYELQLDELRAILRSEEEKLQQTKHHNESRDKELGILLLRTDIDKLALLLRSQLAREEANDIRSGAVDPALTRPSALSGVDGIPGRLPRLSIFMLKQVKTLQLELRHHSAQLELMYMNKQVGKEEVAAKKMRIKDLRVLIHAFEGHYKADRDKEAAMRKWRFEAEDARAKISRPPGLQPEGSETPVGTEPGPSHPQQSQLPQETPNRPETAQ